MSDHEIHEEGLTRREALKRGAILGGVALAWTTPAVQIVGMSPAFATTTSPVGQGCTPGYWKNNASKKGASAWPAEISPTDPVSSLFDIPVCVGTSLGDVTLLVALDGGGGEDLYGAAQILVRAAIAAVLNNTHPLINYGTSDSNIALDVNSAMGSCNRDTMLSLASTLDMWNNAGCPLNMHGEVGS